MKRSFLIIFLGFLIGLGTGYVLRAIHAGRVSAKALLLMQEKEITAMGKRAYRAYIKESPDIGIWALKTYIERLKEIIKERGGKDDKGRFFIISPMTDLALSHGRLMLLYKRIKEAKKARYHLYKALSYSKKAKLKIGTEQELIDFLKGLDSRIQ